MDLARLMLEFVRYDPNGFVTGDAHAPREPYRLAAGAEEALMLALDVMFELGRVNETAIDPLIRLSLVFEKRGAPDAARTIQAVLAQDPRVTKLFARGPDGPTWLERFSGTRRAPMTRVAPVIRPRVIVETPAQGRARALRSYALAGDRR